MSMTQCCVCVVVKNEQNCILYDVAVFCKNCVCVAVEQSANFTLRVLGILPGHWILNVREGPHPLNILTFQFSILIYSPSVQCKKRKPVWISNGCDSSVGIATCYGLDGPGIEFRWGKVFLHLSRSVLGPTQPPIRWVLGHSWG